MQHREQVLGERVQLRVGRDWRCRCGRQPLDMSLLGVQGFLVERVTDLVASRGQTEVSPHAVAAIAIGTASMDMSASIRDREALALAGSRPTRLILGAHTVVTQV